MSLSYRSQNLRSSCGRGARRLGALAIVTCMSTSINAAEVYVQPAAEARVEVDNNRNFVSAGGGAKTIEGYTETAGATIGIATPQSDTTIKPQIGYVDFPQVKEHELEALADFLSYYHSPRTDFSLYSRFDRRDTYNSELASALFNPLNPNFPTTPETGRVTVGEKRTVFDFTPSYQYHVSPRLNLGVSGAYENVDYTATIANTYVPYDYWLARTFANWALSPRSGLTVAVFGSRYSATGGSAVSNAHGATVGFDMNWSKTFSSSVELLGQQNDNTFVKPAPTRNTSNNVGATLTTSWKGQISSLQLIAGRTFTPSGAGGIYRADQFQVEYDRNLSARFVTAFAVRYIKDVALSVVDRGADYDYLNATAELKWMATRTFYVLGGAGYLREHYFAGNTTANNGMVYAAFGYRGLGRRP
jgi:hypothetical protein